MGYRDDFNDAWRQLRTQVAPDELAELDQIMEDIQEFLEVLDERYYVPIPSDDPDLGIFMAHAFKPALEMTDKDGDLAIEAVHRLRARGYLP